MSTEQSSTRKVFLVDDHPVFRAGMSDLLEMREGLTISGYAQTVEEATELLEELVKESDLIILDLSLPDGSGLELLKTMRSREIEVPVLVVSRHDERLYATRCLQAGAQGYVTKGAEPVEVVQAATDVLDGRLVVSDDVREQALRQVTGTSGEEEGPFGVLSDRELEVFEFVGRGFSTGEIAERLSLSAKTVHTYRQRIRDKLGLERQGELVRRAVKWVEDA